MCKKLAVEGYLIVVPYAGDGYVISKNRPPKAYMNATEARRWGEFIWFNEFAGKRIKISIEELEG